MIASPRGRLSFGATQLEIRGEAMMGHRADVTSGAKPKDPEGFANADESDDASLTASERAVPAALFAAIALMIGIDAALHWLAGADLGHLALEAAVFTCAAGGFLALWRQVARARKVAGRLRSRLALASEDAARWRAESQALLAGLGEAIDRQFRTWQLSGAEREVGLLLLKGISLKEIALARGTSERTVRQQALAIYKKAEVAGRAELSAFFLEDLLLPVTDRAEE